ncbi:MAG: hypothetical protein WD691_07705 [Acidimicrobiales bacterium]
MTEPAVPQMPPGPSSVRYRMAMALAVIVAGAALFAGVRATKTGDPDPVIINGRPDVVEHFVPAQGVQALHQTEVGIDLTAGYEGTLLINGVAIPTDELRLVPEQNQVFFLPAPDRTFASLPAGRNCITAIVWKSAVGRGRGSDLSFDWCFDVH